MKILFVCLGNICRSPAAENTLRHLAKEQGVSNLKIESAGTANYHTGKSPDSRMMRTLQRRNIKVSGSARQFSKKDFTEFDYIFAMDEENRSNILDLTENEEEQKRVLPFMSLCPNLPEQEVPDPYYGGPEGFEHVADIVEEGCLNLLRQING